MEGETEKLFQRYDSKKLLTNCKQMTIDVD